MHTASPAPANPRRKPWPRILAAIVAAVPTLGFLLIGSIWLFLVARDRFVYGIPPGGFLPGLNSLHWPSLLVGASLLCLVSIVLLARTRRTGLTVRLLLTAVAMPPAAIAGIYSGHWLVERFFLLSIAIRTFDAMLHATLLALCAASVAALIWLGCRRR